MMVLKLQKQDFECKITIGYGNTTHNTLQNINCLKHILKNIVIVSCEYLTVHFVIKKCGYIW